MRRGRPLLHDEMLPPLDWRGVNRHRLRLDDEDLGEMEGIPGIPYRSEWTGEEGDRYLVVMLSDGRRLECCAISMTLGPGPWPKRPVEKARPKKKKPAPQPPPPPQSPLALE